MNVIEMLIASGANLNFKDEASGDYLIHIAVKSGSIDTVLTLLQYGANPSNQDANGQSAFELAPEGSYMRQLLESYR